MLNLKAFARVLCPVVVAFLLTTDVSANAVGSDGLGSGLPAEGSFDASGPFDNAGLSKVDAPPSGAAASWPFRGAAADIDAAEEAQHLRLIAKVAARNVPLAPPETPNYLYYWGAPLAMRLDPTRLAMLVDEKLGKEAVEAAEAAAAGAGVAVSPGESRVSRGWVRIKLAQPLTGFADANARIEQILKAVDAQAGAAGVAAGEGGKIAFVSPVFENDEVPGGYVHATPEILARVRPERAHEHLAVLKWIDPTLDIVQPTLGTLSGAAKLRSRSRNGFAVMAQANRLVESGECAGAIGGQGGWGGWAEVNFIASARTFAITPNDANFGNQWHHRQSGGYDMNTDLAWEFYTFGRSGVRSLIIDAGIDLTHADLDALTGRDFTTGEVNGIGDGTPQYQCDNHGTAVAGCIAELYNTVGGAGVAPSTRVISGKAGYDDENPDPGQSCDPGWSMTAEAAINSLAWGSGQGISTSNCSWGRWPPSPGFEDQLQDAAVNHQISNFASTGNDGIEGLNWPARAPYMNAVGNLTSTGARNTSSNWGDEIDFTAPGTSIYTTDRSGAAGYSSSDYTTVSGTSFASPNTAGIAALLYSAYPFISRGQVYAAIRDGCIDAGAGGWDIFYGHGRVDAYNALSLSTPEGDLCSSPIIITTPYSYNPPLLDTTWATDRGGREPQADCDTSGAGESSSVFYWFIAPTSGYLNVNTNGSNYDTVLSIFSGCGSLSTSGAGYSGPTPIACDDDGGTGVQSQITNVFLDDGRLLLIKVSKWGQSGGGGLLDFNLTFTSAPPPNDLCGDAFDIPLTTFGSYNPPTYSTELATRSTCDGSETCGVDNANGHSVWYRFVCPADGIVTIDTSGSNYNTVAFLYHGSSCPLRFNSICLGPALQTCDEDSGSGTTARIQNATVQVGETYLIKVSAQGSAAAGRLDFNFTYGSVTVPPNDACDNAAVLSGAYGTHTQPDLITLLATRAFCDPVSSCGDPAGDSNSVWYSLTPAGDALFHMWTSGSNYDTVLSLYTGSCPVLVFPNCTRMPRENACGDNISSSDLDSDLTTNLQGGTTYLIKIADKDTDDEGGLLKLSYALFTCPADINSNGDVTVQDIFDFLTAYFAGAPAADVNGVGGVTVQDIFDFLAAYFVGC